MSWDPKQDHVTVGWCEDSQEYVALILTLGIVARHTNPSRALAEACQQVEILDELLERPTARMAKVLELTELDEIV